MDAARAAVSHHRLDMLCRDAAKGKRNHSANRYTSRYLRVITSVGTSASSSASTVV
jgi:hypothetical protein